MVENSLYFTIKGTKFKQCGLKRSKLHGQLDLVFIKNCNTNTYKWMKYDKLQEVLKNNYNEEQTR